MSNMQILIDFRVMVSWIANSIVIYRFNLDGGRNVLYLLASLMSVALVGLSPGNRFSISGRIVFDSGRYWISKLNLERNWTQWA